MARESMLDDEIVAPAEQQHQVADVDGIPYCRKHHCRMRLASGAAKSRGKDYYHCPVDGCKETGVKVRTIKETLVPQQPQMCARCRVPTVCEHDGHRSTATMVVLTCPRCGWHLPPIAIPQLAAAMDARKKRPPIPNIGDR